MLASSQRLLVLHRLPWLADLPVSEVAPLAGVARERVVQRGQTLNDPGQPPRHVHVVVEGTIETRAFPSPAIGLVEVLAQDGMGLTAVAGTDSLVLELSADDLHEVMQDCFPLLLAVVRGLARATVGGMPPVFPGTAMPACRHCRGLRLLPRYANGRLFDLGLSLREVRVSRGTELWQEGDPSGYGIVVLAGEVMTTEWARARIDRALPGSSLGLREALAGLPRWHDAVAVADSAVLRVDTDAMVDVLEDQIDLATELTCAVARGLLEAHRKVA